MSPPNRAVFLRFEFEDPLPTADPARQLIRRPPRRPLGHSEATTRSRPPRLLQPRAQPESSRFDLYRASDPCDRSAVTARVTPRASMSRRFVRSFVSATCRPFAVLPCRHRPDSLGHQPVQTRPDQQFCRSEVNVSSWVWGGGPSRAWPRTARGRRTVGTSAGPRLVATGRWWFLATDDARGR